MTEKKIALFIDADNISSRFGKQILDALENRGEVFIRRIYGNWEKSSLHSWNDCIRNFALRAVQQTDFASGKNATDMSLTIDAMDVLHAGKTDIFALVSNDSDFTPLVIRLREGGMNIIGIGTANASNAFRAACNDFIDLNTLIDDKSAQVEPVVEEKELPAKSTSTRKKKSPVQMSLFDEDNAVEHKPQSPPAATNPKVISLDERKLQSERDKKIQQMHNALQESARAHADKTGFASLNDARQDVRQKNFNFTVHDFGYGQLKDFIVAYPKIYETRQDDNGQHFYYRCLADKPKVELKAAPVVDDRIQQLHDVLHEAAAQFDDNGFANLCSVGAYVNKQNLGFGVKDLGYGKLQKFIAAFPDIYELRRDENNAYFRCRQKKNPVDELEQLHNVFRETALLYAEGDGFVNLWWACDFIIGKKNLVREIKSMSYKDLAEFLSAFPQRYEIRQDNAQNFFYRCC